MKADQQSDPPAELSLITQFLRYFGVALIGLVVDFGVLVALTSGLGVYYLIGTAAGFISGLIVTYALSEKFVFVAPKIASPVLRFLIFAAIGLVGLALLTGLMWLFTGVLGFFYIWSKVGATAIVYVWNFFARRLMYGAKSPAAIEAPAAAQTN
jgi:putative flippase GtrA